MMNESAWGRQHRWSGQGLDAANRDAAMIVDAFTAWLDGRLRERALRHLAAAVDAVDKGEGATVVIRIPRGTATVEVTAYPAKAQVLVDSPPIV